jgi:hypothetical protein
LLLPAEVVTIRLAVPAGAPAGTLTVAVAEVELTAFTLLPVTLLNAPLPALSVIGAPNRAPVSVTGIDMPAAANGGLMLIKAGSTLIEIV